MFQSEIESVSDILPRETDLPGWNRISLPAEFSGMNVRKYRKEYHDTGIERLSTCNYHSFGENNAVVSVEVIKFDSVLNSYGFFSRSAGFAGYTTETINEYSSGKLALALRGEYIVYAFTSDNEGMAIDLKNFIKSSLKYISENYVREKLPEKINVLKGPDKYGIIYSRTPIKEQKGIGRIFYTLWGTGKEQVVVFISEQDAFSDSYMIFRNRIREGYIVAESGTVNTAFKKENDGTFTFISAYDKWLYGCWSSGNIEQGKKITQELKNRINGFIR